MGVLCNDATIDGQRFAGNPLDTSFLEYARKNGVDISATWKAIAFVVEFTFDDIRKIMSVVRDRGADFCVVAKGAPEAVLSRSAEWLVGDAIKPMKQGNKEAMQAIQDQMTADGMRVLAFAEKTMMKQDHVLQEEAEKDLIFVGLVGYVDPVRPEVQASIAASRAAGIRTLLVSGDYKNTAISVGERGRTGKEFQRLYWK